MFALLRFSTDCGLEIFCFAMRLMTRFFAKYNNTAINWSWTIHSKIHLPKGWTRWFFLCQLSKSFSVSKILHTCVRNFGTEFFLIRVLYWLGMKLFQLKFSWNWSKLNQNFFMVLSRTGYQSERSDRTSRHVSIFRDDDVLHALEDIDGSLATRIYLRLLRSIVLAYVEHDTSIIDRIYHSWFWSVFMPHMANLAACSWWNRNIQKSFRWTNKRYVYHHSSTFFGWAQCS